MASIKKRVGATRTSWVVTFDAGDDPRTGARRQRRRSFATRRAAQDFAAKVRHEQRTGAYLEPSAITVRDLLDRFLAARRTSGKNRGSTLRNYAFSSTHYLVPALGGVELRDLTTLAIQSCIDGVREGASPHAAHSAYVVLDMALRQAVRWRLLLASPCVGVVRPALAHADAAANTWEEADAARFLAAMRGDPRWILWFVALNTGLRSGELTALPWEAVDLERGAVTVARTWARAEAGGWVFNPTKTRASHRVIEVGPAVVDALRAHRRDQRERRLRLGALWQEHGTVVERGDGVPLTPNNEATVLRRRCLLAGVPPISFHGLRHTFATTMLRRGVHSRIVQHYMGHSTAYMTAHYSHVQPIMFGAVTEAAAAAFGGACDQTVTKRAGGE